MLRDGEDRAIQLGKYDSARVLDCNLDSQRFVQSQDRPGFARTWGVVLAGDDDDRRGRQAGPQPVQLAKTVQDGGVRGPHRVKQIARDDNQLRFLLEEIVHRPLEHFRDIHLALVRALGRLPIELAEPEVEVGEVRELHHLGSRKIELSVSVSMSIPFEPNRALARCIFVLPLIVPSRIAPREIENC